MNVSYLALLQSKNKKELNELSLSRAYQHFINSKTDNKSFAILTSWEHKLNGEPNGTVLNQSNFKKLCNVLKSNKLGYSLIKGHWSDTDPKTNQKRIYDEPSLFVVGITFELAMKIMGQFNQQGILYAGPETDGEVTGISNTGERVKIGKFVPNKIADYFSELKGARTFVFEYSSANGFMNAMIRHMFEKENGGPLDVNKLLDE